MSLRWWLKPGLLIVTLGLLAAGRQGVAGRVESVGVAAVGRGAPIDAGFVVGESRRQQPRRAGGMMGFGEAPGRMPPEQRLADRLAAGIMPEPTSARTPTVTVLRELGRVDLAVYRAIADTPTPTLDRWMRRVSDAADRSRLWLVIAAVMAAAGGGDGRRAARAGLVAVAVDSAVVNAGFKIAAHRRRPDRDRAGMPAGRQVPMPHSASFPSGHAASGFAFANAVAQTLAVVAAPLRLLACVVGYSRVHAGVHYPGDVVVGAVIGASVGEGVGWGLGRVHATARLRLRCPRWAS